MNSCLYEGHVRHRRRSPKKHMFNFKMYMLWLDLDELQEVFKRRWLWSTERPAFSRFRESDHLTVVDQSLTLRERVNLVLRKHNICQRIGPVRLLTQLRYLGFAMNPVSFFYCFDEQGESVVAIIAEVNNTPWGEQHLYVIEAGGHKSTVVADRIDKDFHVSPFMSLDMQYRMMFTDPESKLGVKIENYENAERIFDVSMLLEKKTITSWNLNRVLIAYPLMSVQVFVGIYWQALRLYLKGIPFYSHPRRSDSDSRGNAVATRKTKTKSFVAR